MTARNQPRTDQLRAFLGELEWSTTRKYVAYLRERDELLSVDQVDVDLPQVVARRFVCDARRCIQWRGERALVDRSCCSRYEVPVTTRDRERIARHMDAIREKLPEGHRLLDPAESPYEIDDDFGHDLVSDNPLGGCQFNVYRGGRCTCVIHAAALEAGADPCDWKPLACSLWPLAILDYADDGPTRYLLTVYCKETLDLFDTADRDPFACIEDQNDQDPPLYRSEAPILTYLFGARWYRKLERAVRGVG